MRGKRLQKTCALLVASLAIVAVLGAAGCADSTAADPTPVRTFKITPASGAAATPSAAASPGPAATAPVPSARSGGAALDLVARDTQFDNTDLSATAGAVTITFDNRDSGIVHNLHVFRGANAQAPSAGSTKLTVGPVKEDLQLTLDPGAYYFQCDAHPTTMKGTLTVK